MKNYVIIGGGASAVGCIEGIRSVDPNGKITVISRENHPVYARPLISYYLEGKTDLDRMLYRKRDFYEKNGCEVLYGAEAERIDANEKTVYLCDGRAIRCDRLCIATGSDPFVPPFPGLETVEKRFCFMTLDDALALEAAIGKNARVLIIGAGLIGLKCAEGIYGRAAEITVCDLADRVLSSILDSECAGIVQKRLEKAGIKFLLGDSADRFEGNAAIMKSGRKIEFDILVTAVGVRANTSIAANAGCEVNRGIIVNTRMETNLPGVYAAGDCTEGEDITAEGRRVLAIMPNAYIQGETAGINMAGGDRIFDKAMPINSIGFFGLHVMTAGSRGNNGAETVYEERISETEIKKIFTSGGIMTGFVLIGCTERAGIYTSLIREKTPLADVDIELLLKNATSAAFSPEVRAKKFGGPV